MTDTRASHAPRRSASVLALLLVPVLGLVGCTGDDASDVPDEPPTRATEATSPAATDTPIITGEDVPEPPKFKGIPKGIIVDVVTDVCTTDPGTVTASGTVTNTAPGPLPRDIAISMAWAATGGGDVLARGVERLQDVPAGETVDWSVSAELDASVPVECVPTAQRGQFLVRD